LVDDLNAEIGEEGEEDDESNFEHLKQSADGGQARSRNSNVGEKISSSADGEEKGAQQKQLSLDKDSDEEEVKTIDLEDSQPQKPAEPTYDYTVIDEFLEFFE